MKNLFQIPGSFGQKRIIVTKWVLAVFALILFGAVGLGCASSPTQVVVLATPIPLDTPTITASVTPEPPIATATIAIPCETDQNKWNFVKVLPDSDESQKQGRVEHNFKKIEPACVMDGLSETIAFHLFHTQGYSFHESAKMTGLDPKMRAIDPERYVPALAPWDREASYMMTRPAYTYQTGLLAYDINVDPQWFGGYPFWLLDKNDKPVTPTMSLKGCYRTYDVVGNEKVYMASFWVDVLNYDVVCEVFEDVDAEVTVLQALNPKVVVSYPASDARGDDPHEFGRVVVYFGYSPKFGVWEMLARDMVASAPLNKKELDMALEATKTIFDVPIWNSDWLMAKYGIQPVPVPNNWKDVFDDANAWNAFVEAEK